MTEKLIDTTKIWLDVKTVAKLKGVTTRAIRIAIRQKKFITKTEDILGGKSYKICLSSLDTELQNKYLNEYYRAIAFENIETLPVQITQPVQEKIIPEAMKKIALARIDLINLWQEYKKGKKNKQQAGKEFFDLYNTGEFYKDIYQTLGSTSIGTIYRWKAKLSGTSDWTRLVPEYNFKGAGEIRTSLTEEEIQIFMKILLNQNKFSIGKATGLTKHILTKRGYEILPKDITFRRYARWFKKNHFDKWILAREGSKGLRDFVEPYIVRDASVLEVGQVLVSDGKKLNFQLLNPFTGKPCRAVLVGFLDWKSGGLVGFEIMLEEDTQCIASALRNSILNIGRIPEIVYQDNGRAFRAKFFTGDKDFEELGFIGIYGKLGIKPVFASPYNARAKVIERFFLEFQESFEKLLPSYIGSSIDNKPAYMKRNEELHREIHSGYVPTIEEAIRLINCWLEYKHSLPCSNVPDKTIAEVLATIEKQNINEQELDDLMMAQEIKTIHRNGIRFLKSDYYDDTLYGIRDKAIIKYSLFDLSHIKVYSMQGEFLCRAERVTSTHPMAVHLGDINDIQDYKQKIVKQRKLRNKTIKAVKQFLSVEDIEKLEVLVMEEDKKQEIKEVMPTTVKVIAEKPLTRPVFESKFQRYEWHLKNGCHSQEDRHWFENYRKSKEFMEIYGEETE